MSIVEIQDVSHGFGDKAVLRNITVRLLPGEHVGLVGPNGAGKSTLMNILTGELIPDSGAVSWQPGVHVGYLEQHANLTPGVTIRSFLQSAFADLYALEQELFQLADLMSQSAPTQEAETLERQLKKYSELQHALEENDFYAVDAKIDTVASGLGLLEFGLDDTEVQHLSGGQRTKVLLAKLLLLRPQVLLLDEPTNYLDTSHIEWLIGYLKGYPYAFIVISHDTRFLDSIIQVVYHLEHQSLTRYIGNYSRFLEAYALRGQQLIDAYTRQREEIKKLETYIQKNKARASTAKQAKSREKRLNKLDRIDKPTLAPKPRFQFTVTDEPTSTILTAEDLVVGYDAPLLPPLNLTIKRGEKVALIGFNGIGKSTLVKTLLGELSSLGGRVHFGDRVCPQYFAQEVIMGAQHSALEEVWQDFPRLTQKEVRQALALCGLRAEHILAPIYTLSGGEQTKVRLCKLMLKGGNWLVLDEPTNHLDTDAQASLRDALMQYPGTVLIVTHHPEFYAGWVTQEWDVSRHAR